MKSDNFLSRYKHFVFGEDETFDVQKRIFLLITHITLLIIFAGIIVNISLGLDISLTIVTIASFFAVLFFHSIVKKDGLKTKYAVSFFILSVAVLSYLWFKNGGYNGNNNVLIFVYFIVVITILPNKYRLFSFIIYSIMIIGLIILQYFSPGFIVPYQSEQQRFVDLTIGYLLYLVLAYVIQKTILNNYESEREIVKSKNLQLNELITKLNIANQKLEESLKTVGDLNSSKDRFVTILSHDLRSPFHSLMGLSQTLNDEFDNFSEADKKHLATQINLSIGKIYSFLEELLLWGRIQKNSLFPTFAPANIKKLIEQIISVLAESVEKKKITFDINCSEELIAVLDKELISIVIRNLISNSIKFSVKGKKIIIEAKRDANVLIFKITDHGMGIPAEMLSQLFKIDEVTTRLGTDGEKGSGMGLILCKDIIKKHSGELEVQSTVGEGTTITVKIPFNSPLV